jgi:hypothetical protein
MTASLMPHSTGSHERNKSRDWRRLYYHMKGIEVVLVRTKHLRGLHRSSSSQVIKRKLQQDPGGVIQPTTLMLDLREIPPHMSVRFTTFEMIQTHMVWRTLLVGSNTATSCAHRRSSSISYMFILTEPVPSSSQPSIPGTWAKSLP